MQPSCEWVVATLMSKGKGRAPASPLLYHIDLCQQSGRGQGSRARGCPHGSGWAQPVQCLSLEQPRAGCRAAALPWLQQGAVQLQLAAVLATGWATLSNNTTWPRIFYCVPALGVPNCSGFHLSFLLNVACSCHGSVVTWVAGSLFLADFNNNIWNGCISCHIIQNITCLQTVNPIERKQSFTYRPYTLLQEHWQFLRQ